MAVSVPDGFSTPSSSLRRQRLYRKGKPTNHAHIVVNIVATMVFTVLLVFGSLALLSAVIMAIAGIGILLSGVLKTDDDFLQC